MGLTTADVGIREQQINSWEDGVRVILPVFQRPQRAAFVLHSLAASEREVKLRPLFMVSFGDETELRAVKQTGADFVQLFEGRRCGDYARKINLGAALTLEPWVFTGADDVAFEPGWADVAIAFAEKSGLRAIGVNDLGRWAKHKQPPATHFLVARSYLTEGTADERDVIFHTGYDHNYVDTEFMETARSREAYGYCAAAVVEHMHPVWRKGRRDPVYALGQRHTKEDYNHYLKRRQLWRT